MKKREKANPTTHYASICTVITASSPVNLTGEILWCWPFGAVEMLQ